MANKKNKTGDFKQRIKTYIEYKGITAMKFCDDAGLHRSLIANADGTIRSDTFSKIILFYTDLNPYWLLCGKGKMLLEEDDKPFFTPPPRKFLLLQKLKTDIENLKNEKEKLVPEVKNAQEYAQNMKHKYEKKHKIVHNTKKTTQNQHIKPIKNSKTNTQNG